MCCSFPHCELATEETYCRNHRSYEDARVVCLFCKGEFDSLPFYGCCGQCFASSSIVRVLVDASTPQTLHGQEPEDNGTRGGVTYTPPMVRS